MIVLLDLMNNYKKRTNEWMIQNFLEHKRKDKLYDTKCEAHMDLCYTKPCNAHDCKNRKSRGFVV